MATLTDINHVIFPLVGALAAPRPRIDPKLFGQLKQIAASLNKPPESYQIFTPLAERFVMRLGVSSSSGLNPSQQDQLRETKKKIIDLVSKMTRISKEQFEESIAGLAVGSLDEAFCKFDFLSSFGSVAPRVHELLFVEAVKNRKYGRVASHLAGNFEKIKDVTSHEPEVLTGILSYILTEKRYLPLFGEILKQASITAAVADSCLRVSIAMKNHEATSILLQRGILTGDDTDRIIDAELREKLRPDDEDLGSFFEKCFVKPPVIVIELYGKVSDPLLWRSSAFNPYFHYRLSSGSIVGRFGQKSISSCVYRKIDLHQMRAPIAFACALTAIKITFGTEGIFILIHGGNEGGGTTHDEKAILLEYFRSYKDSLPIELKGHPPKSDGSLNFGATFAERKPQEPV